MQKVYAHRGASGYAPENTLEAFELAVRQGAHGVELDVHLSKDGEVVVAHDETIDRVANGSGVIQEMTLSELKKFKFNKTVPSYEKATIPTLREVYELLKPAGLSVNVELKNNANAYEGMEEKCIALAAEMGMTDRVLYSSFNHYSLLHVKELDASLPCGLLYSATMVRPWEYARSLGMDAIHPHYAQLLVPNLVRDAHENNVLVNPWTVDEASHLRLVFKTGADIVITNYPDRALEILQSITG